MKTAFVALALANCLATTAVAQTRCPAAEGDITVLMPQGDVDQFFAGLSASFVLGLSPSSFPRDDIDATHGACLRGTFEVGSEQFVVYGSDDNTPPRWAVGDNPDRIVFLAIIPPPSVALEWARSEHRQQEMSFTEPPVFALAVTNGTKREVFVVLQRIPGDSELVSIFRQALDGTITPFAYYDTITGQTNAGPD